MIWSCRSVIEEVNHRTNATINGMCVWQELTPSSGDPVGEVKNIFHTVSISKYVFFLDEEYTRLVYSRQLWWGHRIPSWHDKNGNFYVAENESAVREKYNLQTTELVQDDDVLDTWFSSALWTFVTQVSHQKLTIFKNIILLKS